MTSDELTLVALRWVRTCAGEDHEQYLRDDAELRASGIDPIDLVLSMASMVLGFMNAYPDWESTLDRMIRELEPFVELGLDEPLERESDG